MKERNAISTLVLKGGWVCDPETGLLAVSDVVVREGRIVSATGAADQLVDKRIVSATGVADQFLGGREVDDVYPAADVGNGRVRVIDVSGLLVTPGLVDLHTHVFVGQDLGVDPDVIGPPSGVTTMIDTGSAGAHLFGAFLRGTVDVASTRIRAFINISSVGTTSILLAGELTNLSYVDARACLAGIAAYPEMIVGVKVRASADVAVANGLAALDRARLVADEAALPLMVHLGPQPPTLPQILDRLGPGDILTHCFTALSGYPLTEHGQAIAAVRLAQERGVIFDVGHGMSGFGYDQARAAIEAGFLPDTISSDLHAYSKDTVVDLPHVMVKFLALGVSLPEVIARTTLAPARAVGLDRLGVGTLRPGAPADLAVLRVSGPVAGGPIHPAVKPSLRAVLTVRQGDIVHLDLPDPSIAE